MTNFYEKYKKLRQDQKIELVDIENRTKINIKYLKAIEIGDFDLVHGPYIRLFLRAYINEIGADPDVALSELSEFVLKKEGHESKEPETVDSDKSTSEKETKENIPPPIKKFKDISSDTKQKKPNSRNIISPNLIKGILFIVAWVVIIIVIRNITLSDEIEPTDIHTNNLIESVANYVNFEQLQADFLEVSSQQTAIEQSLPLIVKIVTTKALGIVSIKDSTDVTTTPLTSGDQKTFSFDKSLDILLHHSDGVAVFINGEKIQDIRSQQTPIQLIFSTEPRSITIKHYSEPS